MSQNTGNTEQQLKWPDGRSQPVYGEDDTVSISCAYTEEENASKPAPVPLQMAALNIKMGGFTVMYNALCSNAAKEHPGNTAEDQAQRQIWVARHLFEMLEWSLQISLQTKYGLDEPAKVKLLTAFIVNGPLDQAYYNARPDNWPDVKTFGDTIDRLNPIQHFALDPHFQKPSLVSH